MSRPDVRARALIESTLRMGSLGLDRHVSSRRPPSGTQVLVVVDQFEELFRYPAARCVTQQPGRFQRISEDAVAFVNLLLEVRLSRRPCRSVSC